MNPKDVGIVTRWRSKLVYRLGRLSFLRRAAKSWRDKKAKLTPGTAAHSHAGAMLDQRERDVNRMEKLVAEARTVIARHSRSGKAVSSPVEPIRGDSWGWHPGVHDGEDLIADFNDDVVAICDGVIVDSRPSGWWGKGAQPSSGHPISDGDGIIQLRCTRSVGPFKEGLVFGYGHTEHSTVRVGQKVLAGQHIGRIGWANAPHIHFMVNDGTHHRPDGGYSGVGDRDPRPYIDYARAHD